jgi:membrane protein YdbS with pleckstrin-like domain
MAAMPSPASEPVLTSTALRSLVALIGAVAAFTGWQPSSEQLGWLLSGSAVVMAALGAFVRSKVTPEWRAKGREAYAALRAAQGRREGT